MEAVSLSSEVFSSLSLEGSCAEGKPLGSSRLVADREKALALAHEVAAHGLVDPLVSHQRLPRRQLSAEARAVVEARSWGLASFSSQR